MVPIKDTISDSELTSLLNTLNAVIFPGGSLSLLTSNYSKIATKVYSYAIDANEKGDYFSILGLCWGVQMLYKLVAGVNLLQRTYSSHVDLKVSFTIFADKKNISSPCCACFTRQSPRLNMLPTRPHELSKMLWRTLSKGVSPFCIMSIAFLYK